MRIISVRVAPVARVFAIAYAVFGLMAFVVYALGTAEYLTLPFGVLGPVFHLNMNLNRHVRAGCSTTSCWLFRRRLPMP
jgi:hypothetical protein